MKEHSLSSRCEPYQPRERLDASLSLADVHLVSLKEGFEGLVVPCKLFGIMAAARPTVFIGHPDSEIGRVLAESDAGVIVRQGDVGEFGFAVRAALDGAVQLAERDHRHVERARHLLQRVGRTRSRGC